MTHLLDWRPALRTDRPALGSFSCTEDPTRQRHGGRWEQRHPAPWELTVRSRIRTCVKPPPERGRHIWLGCEPDGTIGAVLVYEELDGPEIIDLALCAVSLNHRHRGGGVAREMFNVFLDNVTLLADGARYPLDEVGIVAWIDERNRPCQLMVRDFGFEQLDQRADGLQRWGASLQVDGAELI